MALGADSSWTVEMQEGYDKWLSRVVARTIPDTLPPHDAQAEAKFTSSPSHCEVLQHALSSQTTTEQGAHLPPEIILQILSYLPRTRSSQATLHACALVSRSWYAASVPILYHSPFIIGKNFKLFVTTVCPSINAHVRRSQLADMVRRLDMGKLVHDGSKSLTARLLGRVKGGLEEFVAPQASFAVNCLAALSKCHNLRRLDLSLISESLALSNLFHSISPLFNLECLRFPRSSSYETSNSFFVPSWPPNLRELHIAGGLYNESILYFSTIPLTLTSLTIEHCPNLSRMFIDQLLRLVGNQLLYLKINYHMPNLGPKSLDHILPRLPRLQHLSLAIDYISDAFFAYIDSISPPHPLRSLELDSSTSNAGANIASDRLWFEVSEGGLRNLRRIRISKRLGWYDTKQGKADLIDLVEMLEALEREDEEAGRDNDGVEAAVVMFD